MPTGKVKWYDAEKGFGFLSQEEGEDVYVRSDALPAGTTTLKAGARVEFGIVQGSRGDQALQVRLLDPVTSVSKSQSQARRKDPEAMAVIVEDLIGLLDKIGEGYCQGRQARRPGPPRGGLGAGALVLRRLLDCRRVRTG
jgi:CspA family cold shock protein